MTARLEWQEPVAVRQWRWRTEALPEIKRMFRASIVASFILGVPSVWAIHIMEPEKALRVGIGIACLSIILPLQIVVSVWSSSKKSIRYAVEAKGLRRHSDNGERLYLWRDIQSYRIVKHPHVSGMGALEIKVKRFRRPVTWSFNPAHLSEQELLRAMQRHLPLSSLRGFP